MQTCLRLLKVFFCFRTHTFSIQYKASYVFLRHLLFIYLNVLEFTQSLVLECAFKISHPVVLMSTQPSILSMMGND